MRLAWLVVVSITLSGTAHAGSGGFLVPPIEVDLGVGAPVGAGIERLSPSTEILVGAHWASLAWKPTRLDVGAGYVGSFREIDRDRLEPDELRLHGAYLSLATRLARGDHWRVWLTARGELLRVFDREHRTFSALGASARISTEILHSTKSIGRGAAVIGTVALGIYVEATVRELPAELGPVGFTSGISCRLPLVVIGK